MALLITGAMSPAEVAVLTPFLLVQGAMFLRIRQEASRAKITWKFWTLVAAAFVFLIAGIWLAVVRSFAPIFRPVRTWALLWILGSSPSFLLYWMIRRAEPTVDESRRGLVRTAAVAVAGIPFAMEAWGALITRREFRVEEVDLPIYGLHADLEGKRILQISDVHLSPFLSEREFARVIDAANELRPHVAVMTGDLISSWGDPVDACIYQLSRIRADAPLLGCLGNHEIYAEVERYVETAAARKGMTFLRHGRRELRFGNGVLNIAGIDYQPFPLRGQYLRGASGLVTPDITNILLSHNPDVFREAPQQGWQAMLAGHTHRGQVTVEILKQTLNVARILTPYVSGLYVEREASCYVTRGIGTIGIPARLGATPEITLLTLRRA